MNDVKRVPIITRIPIRSLDVVFCTIASFSDKYEKYHIMGVYPTIEMARFFYQSDMDRWRTEHGGAVHYAIMRKEDKKDETD